VHDDLTQLLHRARDGDESARDRFISLVYNELRVLARAQRRNVSAGETVNTTALVHEAFAKLSGRDISFADRKNYFGFAARAMRDVLVDYARARDAAKRGGGERPLDLNDWDQSTAMPSVRIEEVLSLHTALDKLAKFDPDGAQVVELRYFGGLSLEEASEVIGMSTRTVKRRWTAARAWLFRELKTDDDAANAQSLL
jgi:RNA polymerase sigma factor (TIGR02999 family)